MELRKTRKYRNRKKWIATTAVIAFGMGVFATNNKVIASTEKNTEEKTPSSNTVPLTKYDNDISETTKSKNVIEQQPSADEYEKVVTIHRYSEPTGQYKNGSFQGMQLIQDKDSKFAKATKYNTDQSDGGKYQSYSTMGVGYYNKENYYNIWGWR